VTTNALVAAPVDTATPFSGAGLLDSGSQLVSAIESGDWVEGGMAAFSAAADTIATVSDPLGSLIAAGLGWLIDHFEPLKGWFNDLTGDAGEVQAFAQTWTNIQTQLQQSGDELTRILGDVDELTGEAMDAYRRFQQDSAQHLHGAATWAGAMATGLSVASTIVQVVHDIVRDVLSQLVGSAISWASEAVLTLGLATPWIVEQVSTRVASWVAKIGSKMTALVRSVKALSKLLDELRGLLRQADDLFASVLKGGKGGARNASHGGEGPGSLPNGTSSKVDWSTDDGVIDIRSVLDTPIPEPRPGPVDPEHVTFADIPRDGHVFWSGRSEISDGVATSTYGSGGIAAGVAENHGATTLERYLVEHDIAMPRWGSPGAEEAWGDVSARYASAAHGDVHVVLGTSLREGNVWETRELGALQANPDVTRIVTIDPTTGRMTTIFER
jgi:hypothetical protein